MKRRAIPWATALFFLTALSCDKDRPNPDCRDASCCHPEYNEYVEYITDVPAHLGGPPQFSTWGFIVPTGYPSGTNNPLKSRTLNICENSMDKIKGLIPDIVPRDSTKITYAYRVSGKVLSDEKKPRLIPTPVLYIYIDKIEKIKP
jgi:hypothetical protein